MSFCTRKEKYSFLQVFDTHTQIFSKQEYLMESTGNFDENLKRISIEENGAVDELEKLRQKSIDLQSDRDALMMELETVKKELAFLGGNISDKSRLRETELNKLQTMNNSLSDKLDGKFVFFFFCNSCSAITLALLEKE